MKLDSFSDFSSCFSFLSIQPKWPKKFNRDSTQSFYLIESVYFYFDIRNSILKKELIFKTLQILLKQMQFSKRFHFSLFWYFWIEEAYNEFWISKITSLVFFRHCASKFPLYQKGSHFDCLVFLVIFLVGAFSLKEKSPTITVGSFFSRRLFP